VAHANEKSLELNAKVTEISENKQVSYSYSALTTNNVERAECAGRKRSIEMSEVATKSIETY